MVAQELVVVRVGIAQEVFQYLRLLVSQLVVEPQDRQVERLARMGRHLLLAAYPL